MPSIMERYVQGLLLGEKFKDTKRQRKWEDLRQQLLSEQIEDVRQGRKAKQKLFALLKDPQSGMGKLAPFVEAGGSLATAADITGYTSPEEQRGIAEEYTSVDPETIQGLGLPLKSFMPQATITPMGMTVPIKGEPLDISKELRLRAPTPKEQEAPEELVARTERWTKSQETHEKELRKYEHEFGKAWREAKIKKNVIKTSGPEKGKAITDRREFWNLWQEGLPSDLRFELKQRLGLMQPTLGLPAPPNVPAPILGTPAEKETMGVTPEGISDATQSMKKKVDIALREGTSIDEIQDALEAEKEELIELGVDIEELYRYLGL